MPPDGQKLLLITQKKVSCLIWYPELWLEIPFIRGKGLLYFKHRV